MIHRLCKLPLLITDYRREYQYIKDVANVNGYSKVMVDALAKKHAQKVNKGSLSTLFRQHKKQQNNNRREQKTCVCVLCRRLQTESKQL